MDVTILILYVLLIFNREVHGDGEDEDKIKDCDLQIWNHDVCQH